MRALSVAIAAIIPALITVATIMYPVSAPGDQSAREREPAAQTFLHYVPPPHVRVIHIYGATQDR